MLIGVINCNDLIVERGVEGWLVNEVHDQIVAEVPLGTEFDDDVPVNVLKMAQLLQDGMLDLKWPISKESFDWFKDAPVGVDLEWGFDMGNLKELLIN
jgi:hypothetical protein